MATSPLSALECDLDETRAEFAKTGDAGLRWRIGELCKLIKTTPPKSMADVIVKLRLALDGGGDREEDWLSLAQVDAYQDDLATFDQLREILDKRKSKDSDS